MADNERVKQELADGMKDIKGAVKETVGNIIESDHLVEEGKQEQRESGTPLNDDHPGPSHKERGGATVAGEKSGRE